MLHEDFYSQRITLSNTHKAKVKGYNFILSDMTANCYSGGRQKQILWLYKQAILKETEQSP